MDFNKILQDTFSTIGVALIGLIATYLLYLINKLTSKVKEETLKIKDEAQRKLVQDAFNRVSLLATNVVAQTEQLSASAIRQAVADGKVDKTELEKLGKDALNTVYNQLNLDTKILLETELNDVQSYIQSVIESELLKLKNSLKQ